MIIYTVQNGDTLYNIARRYGTTAQTIARDNELSNSALAVGETLVILRPKTVYTVQAGEHLYHVAQQFGVTVGDLWRNNPFLEGATDLQAGQVLTIVPEDPVYDREIAVNAYASPSIDRGVLRKTLPYLTYLTVFAYGMEEDGELIDADDEEIIELARQYGVAPIMLVASVGEDGKYSEALAHGILTDERARSALIEDVATTLARKRYAGVEMDFEYVGKEHAAAYADLIRDLRERLSAERSGIFVSLAPKTSAGQAGLLYEGHDYRSLGEAADQSFLMTYQWGHPYGQPMAVAPMDQVTAVVDYATGEIPREKIMLGMPNYGYDWTLPVSTGERRARALGNVEAVALAKEKRARIEYDEIAQAPHFRYFEKQNGAPVEHAVWFENANTVRAMLQLIHHFDLHGIGIWNATRYFPQLWQVLNHTCRIRKVLS